jgi:dihydrolipoamide dehydrogenase
MDSAICKALHKSLQGQGITFHLNTQVTDAKVTAKGVTVHAKQGAEELSFDADVVLVSIGRKPFTEGLGLEAIGLSTEKNGLIAVDGDFRTTHSHIFAIGDIISGPMLAHRASEEGSAVMELIAGHSPHVNYLAIPSVIYTHPEAAGVGFTEEEAKSAGIAVKSGQFPFMANSRARCAGASEGFVKVIEDQQSGALIGMHIFGASAGELIATGIQGIETGAKVKEIAVAPLAHPTLSEAVKEACLACGSGALHI